MHAADPLPSLPSILFADDLRQAGESRQEIRRALAHRLVRVRRGAYVVREAWESLDPVQQHLLHVQAVVREARIPFLICGASAAAVWGMPFAARWPAPVTMLVAWRGGGSSEPGVARTVAGADVAEGILHRGMPVTLPAWTALEIARTSERSVGVAVLDWALGSRSPHPVNVRTIQRMLDDASYARGRRAAALALSLADGRADSVGESLTRMLILGLGFAPPELQAEFRDGEGRMLVDFAWREVGVVLEFDGRVKYTDSRYTGGDPGDVLWREKRREDRLRRIVRCVVRLVYEDLSDPARVAALLSEAGVPRSPSAPLPLAMPTWTEKWRDGDD